LLSTQVDAGEQHRGGLLVVGHKARYEDAKARLELGAQHRGGGGALREADDAVELLSLPELAHGGVRLVPPNIRRLTCVASPPGAPLQVGVRLVFVLAILRAAEQPVRVAQLESRLLEWFAEAPGAVAEHRAVLRVAVHAEHLELGGGCGGCPCADELQWQQAGAAHRPQFGGVLKRETELLLGV